ncbi:endolytic transglycosylase MltG [Kyrpidia spormannii]|uniref:Aminodeoxychorismate lyase n=1 Tax=Kyrpidia spormannii TaxID=2055160 RepID=A0ACA8Z6D3_9BACL|nr:endolytic transglycosylase MltG [Kyrpidia spormannii]CAB3390309.1 Aminodeoxychorismate lyase [Kyrpidia spormannii]
MLPSNQRNVLLESSIHRGFQQSIQDLGCAPPGPDVFDAEVLQYLIAHLELTREEIKNLRQNLHAQLASAEVLTVEDTGDGRFSFLVRIPYQNHLVDTWLIYRRDVWRSGGVAALSSRPVWKRPRVMGAALVVSYVLIALIAGSVGQYLAGHNQQRLEALASAAGYTLVPTSANATKGAASGTAAQAPGGAASKPESAAPKPEGAAPPAQGQATPPNETITFTLQMGMTAGDLTQFLHDKGLIQDVAAFNQKLADTHVDQDLKPGTYTFQKGMSEDQIIQTLQQGPQS